MINKKNKIVLVNISVKSFKTAPIANTMVYGLNLLINSISIPPVSQTNIRTFSFNYTNNISFSKNLGWFDI